MKFEDILNEREIKYLRLNDDHIPDSAVIIIKEYKPLGVDVNVLSINIGLSIDINNDSFFPKTWLNYSEEKIKKINNNGPKYHPGYKNFMLDGRSYYPYSINVNGSEFINVVNLLDSLYNHIDL